MPFHGESYRVSEALNLSGAAVADEGAALQYLYSDDTTTTLNAGDSILVAILPSPVEATAADEAVISWVLETAEPSSGTLQLTSGADFSYAPDPAAAQEQLGSHTIAGQRTLVVGQTAITLGPLVNFDAQAVLTVTCTSGSVVLRQVRLRVWPPAGPAGAWAPGSSYPVISSAERFMADTGVTNLPLQDSPQAAGAAARHALPDNPASVVWTRESSLQAQAQSTALVGFTPTAPSPVQYDASLFRHLLYLRCEPHVIDATLSGTPGVHPDVVTDDWTLSVRAPGGGPLFTEFDSWAGGAHVAANTASAVASVEDHTVELTPLGTDGLSRLTYTGSFFVPSAWQPVGDGETLPLPSQPRLIIGTASAAWFTDPPDVTNESVSAGTVGVNANEVVPDHEWWDPSLPWAETPQRLPRFFVTYTEVDEDPRDVSHVVGIGKPADDRSVFRVPTPLGTLRELRHGEKVSDVSVCYPLKVKLYDGSWTVVAGMTPDA